MKFWVGVTDRSWFTFLSELKPDEINFWQPGGNSVFKALQPGEMFLFKLHSPLNFIVGGGFFLKHSIIPISLAWDAFEQKNGASDFITFREKIFKYKYRGTRSEPDPSIGCIILGQPFFFEREEWIPVPENWAPNIVQGKTYNRGDAAGASLWESVQERLSRRYTVSINSQEAAAAARYGSEYLARTRLGQGAFRVLVTDAYNRKCAITGEKTLPVLESAHIRPYASEGPHSISNGLLLRSDLHKLFDLGYITVTPDFHVEVSRHIREEYHNGRDYYALQGRNLISLPDNPAYRPSSAYIEWHNENVYMP